jgi:hypothetical protein
VGCLWGGLSSKGRTVDSQPGTRVDGYSHHEQKKRDLQVSKQGDRLCKGNLMKQKGDKRWADKEKCYYKYLHMYIVSFTRHLRITVLCV